MALDKRRVEVNLFNLRSRAAQLKCVLLEGNVPDTERAAVFLNDIRQAMNSIRDEVNRFRATEAHGKFMTRQAYADSCTWLDGEAKVYRYADGRVINAPDGQCEVFTMDHDGMTTTAETLEVLESFAYELYLEGDTP